MRAGEFSVSVYMLRRFSLSVKAECAKMGADKMLLRFKSCRLQKGVRICLEDQNKIRQYMRIIGQVQGVGFRYRAEHAANALGVTGWVRNDWDGSVEMETQGTLEQINKLLTMINQGTYVMIERIDRKNMPLEEYETGFHVRG